MYFDQQTKCNKTYYTGRVKREKKLKFKLPNREPRLLTLKVNKEGPVTAADIELDAGVEVLNPKEVICTLDKKTKFEAELEVRVGRGYATWDENNTNKPNQAFQKHNVCNKTIWLQGCCQLIRTSLNHMM